MVTITETFDAAVKLYTTLDEPTPKLVSNLTRAFLCLTEDEQVEQFHIMEKAAEDCLTFVQRGDEDYLAPLIRIVSQEYEGGKVNPDAISKLTTEELRRRLQDRD